MDEPTKGINETQEDQDEQGKAVRREVCQKLYDRIRDSIELLAEWNKSVLTDDYSCINAEQVRKNLDSMVAAAHMVVSSFL